MEKFSGCVYGPRPTDSKYVIETDELYEFNLVGLPIRVEHLDSQDVGTVTGFTPTPDGRAYIEFSVHDNPAGWTCSDLIKEGRLAELSLKHVQDKLTGKNKRPVEVSLVARGARPGASGSRAPWLSRHMPYLIGPTPSYAGTKIYPFRDVVHRDYLSAKDGVMASAAISGATGAMASSARGRSQHRHQHSGGRDGGGGP